MKYSIFIFFAATVSCAAHIVHRQAPLSGNGTLAIKSSTSNTLTSSHSPASTPSAGTASITNSANVTRTSSSATTPAPTCCYIWPNAIGVNTWWSSSIDVTVATVLTTWIRYNNTIVPGNSTTITVANATSMYGTMGGGLSFTFSPTGEPFSTTVFSACAHDAFNNPPCTRSELTTLSLQSHVTVAVPVTTVSGLPGGLLPVEADMLYGRTFIDNATATTYPSQSLTIQSPTPFFHFSGLGIYTSRPCVATATGREVPPGVRFGDTPDVSPDTAIVARPFPDGDYSNWTFHEWIEGRERGAAAGLTDEYTFWLDEDLADFFASIPFVEEKYPYIGECTPLLGGGEPSVHVPVNQLIETAHMTVTRVGTLPKPTTPKTTLAEPTPDPTADPTSDDEAQPEPTRSPDTQPPETTGGNQPRPTASPDDESAEPNSPEQSSGEEPSGEQPSGEQPSGEQPSEQPDSESPQNDDESDASNDVDIPDIISIIQQATHTPAANHPNPSPAPEAEPTSKPVGDIIASVIGLVPGEGSGQDQGSVPVPSPQPDGQQPNDQPSNGQAASPPVISVGDSIVTANSASEFEIGGQTLSPDGPAITAGGTTFELPAGGNAVVVNGATSPINEGSPAQQTPAAQITIGDNIVTADSNSRFVVGSQTLAAGGSPITVDGSTYSLAPSEVALVVNGQTSPIAVPQGSPITMGDVLATPIASGEYVLPGGQTLASDGPAVTVDGTTYSLATSGSVVVNGVTSPVSVAGVLTGLPDPALILPGTTLLPGSSAVISGTTYSLPATGGGVYINGESSTLPTASPGSPITLPNGVVATPTVVASDLVIGSQTLAPGSAITVSGTTYSLSGSEVVVEAASTTYTQDIEDFEATATSERRTSSRTRSPTVTSSDSSDSADESSAPGPTSTSGASKNVGLGCAGMFGIAFVMCLM